MGRNAVEKTPERVEALRAVVNATRRISAARKVQEEAIRKARATGATVSMVAEAAGVSRTVAWKRGRLDTPAGDGWWDDDTAPARPARGGDAGFTLIELIVAMAIAVVLGTMAVIWLASARHSTGDLVEESQQWDSMNTASTMLKEDVRDAWVIRSATSTEVQLLIRRTDPAPGGGTRCALRDWKVDGTAHTISLTSTVYDSVDCVGDHGTPTTWTTIPRVDATSKFVYRLHDSGAVINGDVENGKDVGLVQWTWTTEPHAAQTAAPDEQLLSFTASAVADATGSDPAARSTAIQARASILTVATVPEGREQPTIKWTNPTPDVVAGWVVQRDAWPENDSSAGTGLGNWVLLPPDTTTWTDDKLPAGWTARYAVYATLKNTGTWNVGPTSNVVVTGLRPATVTNVVATGAPTSIALTWDKTTGATSYDLYRDGLLVAWTTGNSATTFTDGPGVQGWTGSGLGHSHSYQVVAVNRWEDRLTTSFQGTHLSPARIPAVTAADTFTGSVRLLSAATTASGSFTAPAAPTITVTPTTSWGMTVAWTPAAWTGSGPTSKGGVARDRGWTTATNRSNAASPNGTWTPEWAGAENAAATTSRTVAYTAATVAGQYRTYSAATCNAIGCSTASASVTALQRPPTPTCTAVATSTRAATVTVDRPAIVSAYSASQVSGGAKADGAGSISGLGITASATFSIDGLRHGSGQTFSAANQNGSPANSGWSDPTSCSTTTPALGISITGASSTTRAISATAAATNGTSQDITLEGIRTDAGLSATWDGLADGTGYTITARNHDGVNDVVTQLGVSTQVLPTPAAPGCSLSVSDGIAPGAITVSGGSQVRVNSGTVYGAPHTYSGLAGGTYTGQARNLNTDGVNTNYSGWAGCGSGVVGPGAMGNVGPGYNASDVCNGWMGTGWTALDAAWVDGGAAGNGYLIGNPVPVNQLEIGPSLYGAYISGSPSSSSLQCTFYRKHYVSFADGSPVPLAIGWWWDSAGWNQATGGMT